MAKKSAKSKGYRKVAGKKPYLSKRDIVMLCVLLAAVAVGAFLLFSYDDGALKVQDGRIVDAGDNWLVVNGASNGRRYYKVAEMGDMPGYTMGRETMPSDANVTFFKYTPEDETSVVSSISVTANSANAAQQAKYYASLLSEFSPTEPAKADAGDVSYLYFTYSHDFHADDETEAAPSDGAEAAPEAESAPEAENAGEGEQAPNRFEQAINAYVDVAHGAVGISIACEAASAEACPDEEALQALVAQALAAIKLELK